MPSLTVGVWITAFATGAKLRLRRLETDGRQEAIGYEDEE